VGERRAGHEHAIGRFRAAGEHHHDDGKDPARSHTLPKPSIRLKMSTRFCFRLPGL
jgi:hypothetical protein